MIRVTVKWHAEATESLWKEVRARIARATKFLWERIREEISVPGPSPSRPGKPPHKQTAWLYNHVTYEVDEQTMKSKVKVKDTPYSVFLEYGTRLMAARAFLAATVAKYFGPIKAIVEGTGKAA